MASNSSITALSKRLAALTQVCGGSDLTARARLVETALDVDTVSTQFLSNLYDVCVESVSSSGAEPQVDGGDAQFHVRATCAAAALLYLRNQGTPIVQQYLDSFFLPLLALRSGLPDRSCTLQASTQLAQLLAAGQMWKQLQQLAATACDAVDASIGAPGHMSGGSTSADGTSASARMQLATACMVLSAVASELQKAASTVGPADASGDVLGELRRLVGWLLRVLPPALCSPAAGVRQAALRALVPVAVGCARACGADELASLAQAIWRLSLGLLAAGGPADAADGAGSTGAAVAAAAAGAAAAAAAGGAGAGTTPLRTALALLVQTSGLLTDSQSGVDVAGCAEFWERLRACLSLPADTDAMERKRALLLLQRLAPAGQMASPGWALWGALYDILDEFPIHLVAPMWAKIDQLHAPAPEFRTEAVVPKSYIPRNKELKQRKGGAKADGAEGDSGAAAAAALSVPPEWRCVLWARALQHGNVQVQRLAMRTFLQRDWRTQPQGHAQGEGAGQLRGVPLSFVTGVFLPSLIREHHYRGGGAEAEVVDVQAQAGSWLRGWFSAAPLPERAAGLLAGPRIASASDVPRLGLQQLMRCVAEAAHGAAADGRLLASADGGAAALAAFPGAMLTALRAVLVSLANLSGMSYKRSVWESVLAAAAAVTPVRAAGLRACLWLLQELPPATLQPSGELRQPARAWLLDTASTTAAASPAEVEQRVASWFTELLDDYWGAGSSKGDATTSVSGAPSTPVANDSARSGSGAADAAAIGRLLLLVDDSAGGCTAVLGRLKRTLYGMYGRPYLQAAEVDRALGLLKELLTVVPLQSSGPGGAPSALQRGLLELAAGAAEDLCGVAGAAADAFWEAAPAQQQQQQQDTLARADAAWACVALALQRLAASTAGPAAPAPAATADAIPGAPAAVTRLCGALLALLAKLGTTPLAAGAAHGGPQAAVAGLRAALRASEALRLSSVSSPAVRAATAQRYNPSALAAAALRDTAAAVAAAAATATGSPPAGFNMSSALASIEEVKWPLLDAITACAAEVVGRPSQTTPAVAITERTGDQQGSGDGAGDVLGGGRLVLQRELLVELMGQAVAALGEYPEGQVLPLLRCARRCWVEVLAGGPELQEAAARALGVTEGDLPDGAGAGGGGGSGGGAWLAALCWAVVRALWNALCAMERRPGPVCAAFVNTALLPALYLEMDAARLQALHGPGGPCRWLLSRLLEWGGASSRFLLLLSCQLSSFLPLQPALVGLYAKEIQMLLLWGTKIESSYDPDGPASDVAEGEELAAVAAPRDPGLVAGGGVPLEVAPRVALLCALQQMAEDAGTVWPPPAPAASSGHVNNGQMEGKKQEQQQKEEAESGVTAPPKRPVIVFGESPEWEEAERQEHGKQAGTEAESGQDAGTKAGAKAQGEEGEEGQGADYGAPPPPDPSHPSLLAGRLLWRQLAEAARTDPVLSTDKVRNGSELHRQKVRLWQSLVVLSSFVPRSESGEALAVVLGQVAGNNPPTIKQYMEAVAAALVLREPDLLHQQLLPLVRSYGRHLASLGSYILIAAQVLLHAPPAVQRQQLQPLLLSLSPWLMCHGHSVRTYAQLVMWSLLQRFPPTDPVWGHSIGDLSYLRQMLDFMATNVDLVRLRRNIGDPILEWHPAGLAHPRRVFASGAAGVCLAGSPCESATFEGVPPSLVDRIQAFLVSERHRLREELSDRAVEREFTPQDGRSTAATTSSAGNNKASSAGLQDGAAGAGAAAGVAVGDFQRKITPEAMLAALEGPAAVAAAAASGGGAEGDGGLAAALFGLGEEEDGDANWKSSSSAPRRHDVLLVASLIDKLPNLAGLARTCEVLGAGRLVLADVAVTKDPQFTAVSVTAEQWLPVEEVKPAALLAWLERKAAEGYTLVGLEQTAESVRLPDYRWPQRAVLVLGREKEGLPPEVLSLLDVALEIPQRGIIRSLNVHVTGAIALYEYVRQQQLPAAAAVAP